MAGTRGFSSMRRLLWVSLLAVLSACPSVGTDEGDGFVTVGPEGTNGPVVFKNVGASIDVPRGALTEETQIQVTSTDQGIPAVPGRKRISTGYHFFPSTLVFKEPITIT